jgi:hypothetical protein
LFLSDILSLILPHIIELQREEKRIRLETLTHLISGIGELVCSGVWAGLFRFGLGLGFSFRLGFGIGFGRGFVLIMEL